MKKSRKAKATKKVPLARAKRTATAKPIRTFYKYPKESRLPASDTMGQELASAAQRPDAVQGIRRFLKKYKPPDHEYQDGFHRNRVRAAQFELMRLEYLKGNVKAGDRLLSQLQDPDI
jgi:hypothetical protein